MHIAFNRGNPKQTFPKIISIYLIIFTLCVKTSEIFRFYYLMTIINIKFMNRIIISFLSRMLSTCSDLDESKSLRKF